MSPTTRARRPTLHPAPKRCRTPCWRLPDEEVGKEEIGKQEAEEVVVVVVEMDETLLEAQCLYWANARPSPQPPSR